jgi:Immunoglobulin-like domain of bacterial spore germination
MDHLNPLGENMKRFLFATLILIMSLAAVGCNAQTVMPLPAATDTSVPPATQTPLPQPAATVNADLSLDPVKNTQYIINDGNQTLTFTLVNGTYQNGTDTTAPDYYQVTMSDKMAFGDLNGDGVGDAAVSIGINMGGSGVFEYVVAFVSNNGKPVEAGYYFVDDRARLDSLNITNQKIVADAVVHGPNDPMCCPTIPVEATLELPFDGSLNLLRTAQTSKTPTGEARQITITSPEQGAPVSNPCTISGGVTIAPFENTLAYHVYDAKMKELASGPVTVKAPDLGAPGTFDFVLDITSTGYTGQIFVTISDISAADGSTLAMNSVLLNLK